MTPSYVALVRTGLTDKVEITLYTEQMKKVAVMRGEGLSIKNFVKRLPQRTEYFFDKFLLGEFR